MVAIQDLRIGNYIQLFRRAEDKEMTHHKIKSIYFDDDELKYFIELEDGFCVNVDTGIEPIVLSEDILLKYGFNYNAMWEKDNIALDSENRLSIVDGSGYGVIFARDIIYLHQIQNIYFDIKQKEIS